MAKIKLDELKAAMALACHDDVKWVRQPVVVDGKKYIVAQVPADNGPAACAVFRSYGLSDELTISGTNNIVLMPQRLEEFAPIVAASRPPLVLDPDTDDNETKNKFLRQLHDAGVERLEVTYSGSGDSSNPSDFDYGTLAPLPFPHTWNDEIASKWNAALAYPGLSDKFEEEVDEWIYEELASAYDTVNNDGGGGTLTFDLTDPSAPVVTFTLYTNETVQNEHLNHEV